MIKVQPETLVGEEVTRQMERKMAKEDLLELDAGYTYDEEMKKELEQAFSYAYPYESDTGLYTLVSVSELKKQSQIGREEEAMGTGREEDGWIRDLDEEKAEDSDKETEAGGTVQEAEASEAGAKEGKKVYGRSGGSKRGTAYHRALECLSFHELHSLSDTKKALFSLYEQGYLDQESYEWINPWDIWKFVESRWGNPWQRRRQRGGFLRNSSL